jgi:hypothetical protein
LADAVGSDLCRCREYREITGDLESNGRRAVGAHHSAELRVLIKGSQQAAMVKGWWAESFHQAANVCGCDLLQVMQLL